MAKGGSKAPARASPWPGRILIFMLLVAAGWFAPTTALVIPGLLPTLVALLTDRDPERTAPLAVGVLNLTGVAPVVWQLWQQGHTMGAALFLLSSPMSWLIMYGAAGVAWGILIVTPPLATAWLRFVTEQRLARLRDQQERLVEEWGVDVAGPGAWRGEREERK